MIAADPFDPEVAEHAARLAQDAAMADWSDWPAIRRALGLADPGAVPASQRMRGAIAAGGIAAGPYSPDQIPGGLYRVHGMAPDLVGMALYAAGLGERWAHLDADQTLAELAREYAVWKRAQDARADAAAESARARAVRAAAAPAPTASVKDARARAMRDGSRRFEDHLARLEARWGSKLDTSAIAWEWLTAYESGARVEINGQRGTIGCTSSARPQFVLMVSIPLEPQ